MNLNNKKSFLIGLLSIATFVGCGGSSNNDQGTSFTAIGFYTDSTGEAGDAGSILTLFTDVSPTQTEGLYSTTFMGFQNNLSNQFIRVSRIDCSYEVQGSFIDIPSDSFPGNVVLASSPVAEAGAPAPESAQNSSKGYTEFIVVSPDIYSYLNNNRAYLPELPFRMTATCSGVGVTQAGDILTTNPLNYFVQFVEESECCTGAGATPGFQTGPGAGGDLITAEDGAQNTTANDIDTIAINSNGAETTGSSTSNSILP